VRDDAVRKDIDEALAVNAKVKLFYQPRPCVTRMPRPGADCRRARQQFPERFLLRLFQASLVARFLQETSDGANAGFNGVAGL
jgi:hypothetical protein